MDELKINSSFMRRMVSKVLDRIVYKKLGYKVDITLNDLSVTVTDERAHVNLKAEVGMDVGELKKISRVLDSRK